MVKVYALNPFNEQGGYAPEMVEANTLPPVEGRERFVSHSDYAALEAQLAERVKVKPLEWEKTVDGFRGSERREQWAAATPWGSFYIWHYQWPDDEEKNGARYTIGAGMTPYQPTGTEYPTLAEAKAAAQADYERRVLSALEATPPAPKVTEADDERLLAKALVLITEYGRSDAKLAAAIAQFIQREAALTAAQQPAPKVTEAMVDAAAEIIFGARHVYSDRDLARAVLKAAMEEGR